jgi:hypothetical protein
MNLAKSKDVAARYHAADTSDESRRHIKGATEHPTHDRAVNRPAATWRRWTIVALAAVGFCHLIGCGDTEAFGPRPSQDHRTAPLTPVQFDECAARFADALRRWPAVDRADAPVLLAHPQWKNQTDLPVNEAPSFVRRLTEAVNLRTGAKVQLAAPGTVGCRYATELALLPAEDGHSQPIIVLALRVVRPGLTNPVLEEVCPIEKTATTGSTVGLLNLSATRPAAPPAHPAPTYQCVRFDRGEVYLDARTTLQRVAIIGERTWRDASGQLCVELKLLSRPTDTTIDVLPYHTGAGGRQLPLPRPLRQKLTAGHTISLVVTFPKDAIAYTLYIAGR